MKNLTKLLLIGGTSAVLALTGCEMMHHDTSDRTAGRVLDDHTITDNVKSDLSREPVYKFTDVDVKTFAGVVQLSGFVTTDAQKQRAGEIAQNVQGVAQVQNNISLKPENNLAPTSRDYNNNYNNNQNQPAH
ncbi:MAG TPA: BON domain-containing protein [Verrucomicrobiae bacterium]|nr:BON domain-containing protein [Verrucomicrobiae bacterium]